MKTACLVLLLAFICCAQQEKFTDDTGASIDSLVIEFKGVDSLSVFDILMENNQIDYQSSSMGVFVKGIDSVFSNSQYYWIYSVNDTIIPLAADKYITDHDDIIKWHYRKGMK